VVARIRRFYSNEKRSLASLLINGVLQAFILEPGTSGPVKRIPAGNYALALRHSPKFSPVYGHPMIEICNVPGRTDILMHPGVFEMHTLGCALMGAQIGTDLDPNTDAGQLAQSRAVYEKVVYPILSKAIKEEFVDLLVEDCDG